MFLSLPSVRYEASYLAAVLEWKTLGEKPDLEYDTIANDFSRYVETVRGFARGQRLSHLLVPYTSFWGIQNGEFVGEINIRHHLNQNLMRAGGHIGYSIRPTRRREGHATAMLKLALPKARALGIRRALVTCDEQNVASRKVIEAAGGLLENIVEMPESKTRRMRFWIDARPSKRAYLREYVRPKES